MNDLTAELENLPSVIVIDSPSSLDKAVACLKGIKVLQAKVNDSYGPIVDKLHKAHKEAIAQRDKFLKPLKDVEDGVKSSILRYNQKLEAVAREVERIANERLAEQAEQTRQELLAKANTAGEWESETLKDEAAEIVAVKIDHQTKYMENVTVAQIWKFEVIDESLVPRHYLMIDESALGKLARVAKENASVPGVRFFNARSVRV